MDRLSTKGQMIDQIDLRNVPHSGFDRSNHNYGTGRLGSVQPTRLDEVYPGDRIKGNPEVVVNFEPLAAPLMGSLVVKQESFFVPYIQLWRHAYKFFSGKNGFNEPMPSVSPLDIFKVYEQYVHADWIKIGVPAQGLVDNNTFAAIVYNLHKFASSTDPAVVQYSDVSMSGLTLAQDLAAQLERIITHFHSVYDGRKMFDLVQPVLDIIKRFVESETVKEYSTLLENASATSAEKSLACHEFATPLGNLIEQIFNYFHGPSSLFDYLGWPTPLRDDAIRILIPLVESSPVYQLYKDRVQNIFQFVILLNIASYGSFAMKEYVEKLFSSVPLVFNPFKAYYLIWYWNYRDQLLETGILDPEEDEFLGSDITANVILYCTLMRQRCWFKDTFTTALTNTGSGNLLVPTEGYSTTNVTWYNDTKPLEGTMDYQQAYNAGATCCVIENNGISYRIPINYLGGALNTNPYGSTDQFATNFLSLDLFDRIKRLRAYVQKRLILGYEVDDVIWSSFMVRLSNVRMHIPEILGRGRDAVQINTVVNNTSTDQQIAGDKTATAWAHGQHSEMDYFAEEWGLYLSFMTIMPIQSYAGGMQRLYLKRDPLDYAWPEFATMGMDAVYNCELGALGARLSDEQGLMVFGYQGRYYDLKSRQDEEHGRLLTDLNYLTFSREWDRNNPPKLNYIFVHCWPRLDGFVMDDPTQDVFRYDCYNAQGWERRLPVPSEIVG